MVKTKFTSEKTPKRSPEGSVAGSKGSKEEYQSLIEDDSVGTPRSAPATQRVKPPQVVVDTGEEKGTGLNPGALPALTQPQNGKNTVAEKPGG